MLKRVLTTVLFLLILSARPVFAQNDYNYTVPQEEYDAYKTAVENCDSPSLECLVKNTTRFVAMEWVLDIVGSKKTEGLDTGTQGSYVGSNKQLAKSTSLVGNMTNLIAGMYAYPPARTNRFLADVSRSAGIAPAQAQGLGFAALDPVLELWKKFRNISYFFFIILFIVIGFMIMFRAKIGGQAAITAQQAIPSILISLILVTFSYAISGFLIDMMYLSMYMIIGIFADVNTAGTSSTLITMNIFQLGGTFLKSIGSKLGETTDLVNGLITAMAGVENSVTGLLAIISGLTLSLVLAVAIVIAVFRLFFELLKSYASIIVGVVTAPVVLMIGAIPGKNVFSGWIKSMIGNLAAFPAVLLVTVLFYEFTKAGAAGATVKSGGFMPPFLVGNGVSGVASPLLGFALLLALPEVVKKIKETLGAKAGLGEQIAGWAGKNIGSALNKTENMIPVATGGVNSLAGGYYAGRMGWNAGHRGTKLLKSIRSGADVDGTTYGGMAPGLKSGAQLGLNIRKQIDRIKDGRFLDAEDPTILLSKILEGQKSGGDEHAKVSAAKKRNRQPS
ncbi:MAG: hypothetical protein GW947_03445 [Candidatus Pacebacteria bacterium]|nr:hypothetical protein [Candidatus Paceibacterota bacterium]